MSDTSDYYEPHSSPSIQEEYTDMKPSLQTFMSPGDTRTVPRRLYKADVNPDSDYRQWATLKQSTVDRCTSDTQLQLHNVESDNETCKEEDQRAATAGEDVFTQKKEELDLVQQMQDIQNPLYKQNIEEECPPDSPKSIHSTQI